VRLVPTVSRSLLREIRQRLGAILLLGALGAVGAGLLVGMLAVFYDLDASRARFYREQRLADFSLSLKRAPRSALEQVRRHPGVRHLEGRVRIEARVDLPGSPEPITSTALSLPRIRRPVLNDILLVSGTWFEGTRDDQTILNDAFARAHGLHPGDHVQALIMGRQQRLLVVGTALAPEFVYVLPPAGGMVPDPARTGVLYLPLDTLQDWAGLNGAFNEFLGLAWDLRPVPLRSTLKDLERQLDPYGVALSLTSDEMPSVQFLANELHELQTSATIMPALCLGVVGLVLHIVTGRMVTQQRTTIGTLRALGYTRTFIVRHYLGYGLVVGLSSALAGLALGLWIQSAMIRLYQDYFELPALQPTLYPGLLAGALGVAVLFAVAGTVQAALRASRMNPAEAMRPPAPEKGGRILLERLRGLWDLLPFWGKLVLRSVFRNPFRSMVAILTSLAATALLVESLCMVAAMHAMIDHEFRHTSHQDLTVALREPVGRDILSELRGLPGIAKVEPQLVVSADLSRGAREKRTGLTGLAAGNRLFTPLDARGQPLQIPEEGLVLARKLAEVLGVAPGDTLLLRPLIGTRQVREAPVVAVVDTYMGLGAWCRLEYLSRLIGEDWAANAILLDLANPRPDRALLEELSRRPGVVGVEQRVRALEKIQQLMDQNFGTSLLILILFSGLLAFGSVLNTAMVSLEERRREVGTLRVLGYSPERVALVFATEIGLLSAVGIGLGLWAGVGLVHLVVQAYSRELFRLPTVIPPEALFQSAAVMILFVGLAQVVVWRLVARLPWLEVFKVRE